MEWIEKPLTIGNIIGLTFQVSKKYFGKLLPFLLLLIGPAYIVILLSLLAGGTPLLVDPDTRLFAGQITESSNLPAGFGGFQMALYFVGLFILVFISVPIAYASIILAVDRIRKNESFTTGEIIRKAFSRYGALLGGSIVYFLIYLGIYFGLGIIIMLSVGFSFGFDIFLGQGISDLAMQGLGGKIAILILLGIVSLCAFIYLLFRWSFFFPAIVFEKVSPGIGKSWRLTRHNFWRVFAVYLIFSVIFVAISVAVIFIFQALLGSSILYMFLFFLLCMLMAMVSIVAYAITYFDLRFRNEQETLKTVTFSDDTQEPLS